MTALFIGLTVALLIICLCMAYGIKNQRERIEQLNFKSRLNEFNVDYSKYQEFLMFYCNETKLYTLEQAIQHIRKNIPIDEVFTHTEIRIFCEDHPAKINNQYINPEQNY